MANTAIVGINMPPQPPLRTITLNASRMGTPTENHKVAYLWDDLISKKMLLQFVFRDGVTATNTVVASAVDGQRLVVMLDKAPPEMATMLSIALNQDSTFALNLTDGSAGAESTTPAEVMATVRVDGTPAARDVVAIERTSGGTWRVAGRLRTEDGVIDLRVTDGDVYVVAVDDYGYIYQPNLTVAVGDTIRPSIYAGWLYRITEAGALPATEPEWWPIDGDNAPRQLGTARAVAVRYYRPLAHGPVPVEMI